MNFGLFDPGCPRGPPSAAVFHTEGRTRGDCEGWLTIRTRLYHRRLRPRRRHRHRWPGPAVVPGADTSPIPGIAWDWCTSTCCSRVWCARGHRRVGGCRLLDSFARTSPSSCSNSSGRGWRKRCGSAGCRRNTPGCWSTTCWARATPGCRTPAPTVSGRWLGPGRWRTAPRTRWTWRSCMRWLA